MEDKKTVSRSHSRAKNAAVATEETHSRSKAGKSFWELNPHLAGILVTAVFACIAVWAFVAISRMKILPGSFLAALGVLFALVVVLVGLLSWDIGKRARFVSSLVVMVLLSGVFLASSTVVLNGGKNRHTEMTI